MQVCTRDNGQALQAICLDTRKQLALVLLASSLPEWRAFKQTDTSSLYSLFKSRLCQNLLLIKKQTANSSFACALLQLHSFPWCGVLSSEAACQRVDVSNCKASGEKPKDKEGLGTGLVLDIVLDGIRDEVLHLEEYLHPGSFGTLKSCGRSQLPFQSC